VRNLTIRFDEQPGVPDGFLLVGRCGEPGPAHGPRFERCAAEVASLRLGLAAHHPRWLVIGSDAEEGTVQLLVVNARQVYPDIRLAMLGPLEDVARCERWMRRGCEVYLADSTPVATVLSTLDWAAAMDAVIVDRAFQLRGVRSRHTGHAPSLTDRQREVLGLLGRNLMNSEIAAALNLSENTIEFHIRRLLVKLGARNRMQAVRRAYDLGLI
jgi:DNA-binding NarL/FixJ family response regulator